MTGARSAEMEGVCVRRYTSNGSSGLLVIALIVGGLVAIPAPAHASAFTCDEPGLNAALAAGGGPHTFNCVAPTTVTTTGRKTISRDVILDGGGNLTISGNDHHTVFWVNPGVSFEIHNLTVSDGNANRFGGGIYNQGGVLTVDNSTISDSTTRFHGGGIYNDGGVLTVEDSVVAGNRTLAYHGAGLYNANGGTVAITNSTFSHNNADQYAGGIYSGGSTSSVSITDSIFIDNTAGLNGGAIARYYESPMTLTNTTITGNSAGYNGGGIHNFHAMSPLRIINSTISGNSARYGGAIDNDHAAVAFDYTTITGNTATTHGGGIRNVYGGLATLADTILAGNAAPSAPECGAYVNSNYFSPVLSSGHNVVGSLADCTFYATGTDQLGVDPLLEPLADNGGATRTHALQAASPALDVIPPATCSVLFDQRGVARPQGAGCDAGAFEMEVTSNRPPVADANGPYNGTEGSPISLDGTGSSDPDAATGDSIVSYEWELDGDGAFDDAIGAVVSHTFGDDGLYAVGLRVTDTFGETDTDGSVVTVSNVAPTVSEPIVNPEPSNEGNAATAGASFTDPGFDDAPFTCTVDYGDGTATEAGTVNGNTCTGGSHNYADDATYVVEIAVTDKDGGTGTNITAHQVANVAPGVGVNVASQFLQYSDYIAQVTVTATDVPDDPLTIAATWSVDGGGSIAGLPGALTLTKDWSTEGVWVLNGQITEPVGVYTVEFTVTDDDGGATTTSTVITVSHENATVAFDGGNPVAVNVAVPSGDSGGFSLTVDVTETEPDVAPAAAAFGDINLAVVSMTLVPVGPGSPSVGTCVQGAVTGVGYDAVLPVECAFDAVPVNTYTAEVTVDGDYYDGSGEDVLVVYDPSLGFTTGGGWFYWPGTDDKTNFGYTMKYKKTSKASGSFLLIRHMDDGSKYRVKSNALYGLAIGEHGGYGWAAFSGKATYLEPGWQDPIGNHEFVVYVEDHGQPGDEDRVWLEMHDKKKKVITSLSMDRDATDNATPIGGGNIVVPH